MIRPCLIAASLAGPAQANGLDVKFRDGAPLDMFHVINLGCPLFEAQLIFDLTTSAGGVVLDTAYGGRGSQDPAEVQIVAGDALLRPVADGDQTLILDVSALPQGAGIVVTFDSDDTASPAHSDRVFVSGEEIAGATVTLQSADRQATSTFDANGDTILIPPTGVAACLSA